MAEALRETCGKLKSQARRAVSAGWGRRLELPMFAKRLNGVEHVKCLMISFNLVASSTVSGWWFGTFFPTCQVRVARF